MSAKVYELFKDKKCKVSLRKPNTKTLTLYYVSGINKITGEQDFTEYMPSKYMANKVLGELFEKTESKIVEVYIQVPQKSNQEVEE